MIRAMARMYIRGSLAERLWARVDKNGPVVREDLGPCWLYKDGCQSKITGRGSIGVRQENGRYQMALVHRVVWELEHGPIDEGVQILHHCDVANCCRPSHLYAGGYSQNAEDCSSRGRRSSGKVVTREMVLLIRERYALGISQYRLSKEFNLSDSTINCIVHHKTWKHI